jgi:hypothetical protein
MLFELAQDFGMGTFFFNYVVAHQLTRKRLAERPIRCFEVLAAVRASWSKEKTVPIPSSSRGPLLSSRLCVEVRGALARILVTALTVSI